MDEVVNPNDMRMRQFETAFCFTPKLIRRRMILNHQLRKKFQRDIALQLFVPRQPDDSHSASPEDPDQRVTAKNFLSAGKLTRCCAYYTACAFVGHFESIIHY